jgi:hypothetical protein
MPPLVTQFTDRLAITEDGEREAARTAIEKALNKAAKFVDNPGSPEHPADPEVVVFRTDTYKTGGVDDAVVEAVYTYLNAAHPNAQDRPWKALGWTVGPEGEKSHWTAPGPSGPQGSLSIVVTEKRHTQALDDRYIDLRIIDTMVERDGQQSRVLLLNRAWSPDQIPEDELI